MTETHSLIHAGLVSFHDFFSRQEDQEAELEARLKEEEQKLKEEQAKKELEAYLKMKEGFSVEEEGCEVPDTEDEGNLVEKFVNYIKVRIV